MDLGLIKIILAPSTPLAIRLLEILSIAMKAAPPPSEIGGGRVVAGANVATLSTRVGFNEQQAQACACCCCLSKLGSRNEDASEVSPVLSVSGEVGFHDYDVDDSQVPAMLQDPVMAPGWSETVDQNGRTYYQNAITHATQWEQPAALPSGWFETLDQNGRTYYQNAETQVTQVEWPACCTPAMSGRPVTGFIPGPTTNSEVDQPSFAYLRDQPLYGASETLIESAEDMDVDLKQHLNQNHISRQVYTICVSGRYRCSQR